ncbi:hypothetical protein CC78DRAFT_577639 [Lojkania enalia]|uniref:Uncharacterized protein n=1 Tax=Lojkania enalia TaxID=147567 RepID=A0A9P4N8X7_9PLEO|nr:hypothetical protein CC78DRAFT_577639 [Didymosphaeria enalia]
MFAILAIALISILSPGTTPYVNNVLAGGVKAIHRMPYPGSSFMGDCTDYPDLRCALRSSSIPNVSASMDMLQTSTRTVVAVLAICQIIIFLPKVTRSHTNGSWNYSHRQHFLKLVQTLNKTSHKYLKQVKPGVGGSYEAVDDHRNLFNVKLTAVMQCEKDCDEQKKRFDVGRQRIQ